MISVSICPLFCASVPKDLVNVFMNSLCVFFSVCYSNIYIMLSEVVCGYGTFSVLKCLDFDISDARLLESNYI